MVAHIAQAGFEQGKALHKEDLEMLSTRLQEVVWLKELKLNGDQVVVSIANTMALERTPVLFSYKDETGNCCCDIIYSAEGVRQGAAL